MSLESVLKFFKKKGFRITPVRRELVYLFIDVSAPLPISKILQRLAKKGLFPNKSTLYREVEFLLKQQLIEVLISNDRLKLYEWKRSHHHHLMCTHCSQVEEIESDELEKLFISFQKGLKVKTNFKEINHSLEFFGICSKCF